ncbi:hypothetical protein [Nemorincola caseinilytica]|uniref:hypothetical protein n=1 Tax=Nemorincola caseinilytica TaxID=2054315 RepID=UPI0031EA44CB
MDILFLLLLAVLASILFSVYISSVIQEKCGEEIRWAVPVVITVAVIGLWLLFFIGSLSGIDVLPGV